MNLISCNTCAVVLDTEYVDEIYEYIEDANGDFIANPDYPWYTSADHVYICTQCGKVIEDYN